MNTDRVRGGRPAGGAPLWPRGRAQVVQRTTKRTQDGHKMVGCRRPPRRPPMLALEVPRTPAAKPFARPILYSSCVHFVVHQRRHRESTARHDWVAAQCALRQPLCSSVFIRGSYQGHEATPAPTAKLHPGPRPTTPFVSIRVHSWFPSRGHEASRTPTAKLRPRFRPTTPFVLIRVHSWFKKKAADPFPGRRLVGRRVSGVTTWAARSSGRTGACSPRTRPSPGTAR
jgi:hypothetical protein